VIVTAGGSCKKITGRYIIYVWLCVAGDVRQRKRHAFNVVRCITMVVKTQSTYYYYTAAVIYIITMVKKRHVSYIIVCLLFVSDSSPCTLFRGDFGLGDGGAEKIVLSKIMADIGILYWFSPGQLNSPNWEGSNLAANWLWPHIFEIHQCNSINPGACRSFYCSNFDVCRVVCTNQLRKYGKIAPDW